jgi:SAM-dependent methyltransferase
MTAMVVSRPCYLCGTRDNPLIAEEPIEHRFGRPLLPEPTYRFVRCRSCGTLYVDSDVTDEYLSDLYRHESIDVAQGGASVDEAHARVAALRLPEFRRHWDLLRSVRPPRVGDRLMDFGCQMGDFAALAIPSGVIPNGIELSEVYAVACRARWGSESLVHCGPIASAPFAPGSLQYITAFETLEHICDPVSTLRQMSAWLAPGGVLALSVPSSDYFHFKYWSFTHSPFAGVLRRYFRRRAVFYERQVLPHTHIYNFSPASIRVMLQKAGLRLRYLRLTGWHGSTGPAFDVLGRSIAFVMRGKIAFAPSVFVVAERADGGPVEHAGR